MSEFELKTLSVEAIPHAMERVERYRFLNQPKVAESICRDILVADTVHQPATRQLILALTDQFEGHAGPGIQQVLELVNGLSEEYDRTYYTGIVYEREAKARLRREYPGARFDAWELIHTAMGYYERADTLHEAGNEDARLHWNNCARLIQDQKLLPRPDSDEREAAGD